MVKTDHLKAAPTNDDELKIYFQKGYYAKDTSGTFAGC